MGSTRASCGRPRSKKGAVEVTSDQPAFMLEAVTRGEKLKDRGGRQQFATANPVGPQGFDTLTVAR